MTMKLWGVGLGPGDPELVTLKAIRVIEESDVVFIPFSAAGRKSVAGGILEGHVKRKSVPFVFPMIRDAGQRDTRIREQIEKFRPEWEGASSIALPVIGDSSLYATVAYFYDVFREYCPELELGLVPGVSAHSLASCRAERFLALGEEKLAIIPGTSPEEEISQILSSSDAAVIYKPSALGERLRDIVTSTGPWKTVIRVEKAGLKEERIITGEKALEPVKEYLNVLELLRWR